MSAWEGRQLWGHGHQIVDMDIVELSSANDAVVQLLRLEEEHYTSSSLQREASGCGEFPSLPLESVFV